MRVFYWILGALIAAAIWYLICDAAGLDFINPFTMKNVAAAAEIQAAWIQAIGSVAAIFVAVAVAYWSERGKVRERASRQNFTRRRFLSEVSLLGEDALERAGKINTRLALTDNDDKPYNPMSLKPQETAMTRAANVARKKKELDEFCFELRLWRFGTVEAHAKDLYDIPPPLLDEVHKLLTLCSRFDAHHNRLVANDANPKQLLHEHGDAMANLLDEISMQTWTVRNRFTGSWKGSMID